MAFPIGIVRLYFGLMFWVRRSRKPPDVPEMMTSKTRRWALSFVAVAIAAGASAALHPWLGHFPCGLFVFAIALTAQFAGFWPAVTATILSTSATGLLIFEPAHDPMSGAGEQAVFLLLLLAIGLAISLLGRAVQKASTQLNYQLGLVRNITDTAATPIFVTGSNGCTVFANPEAERTFGYSLAELEGHTLHEKIHHHHPDGTPFEIGDCRIAKVRSDGACVRNLEAIFFHKDGTPLPVMCSSAPIVVDGKRAGAVVVAHDMRAQKATQDALIAARRAAEQANAAKDHFLAVLSHELRTPLSPVQAAIELLLRKYHLDGDVRHKLEVVRRNVDLQVKLIDDLLDFTRIARGKISLNRKRVDVCEVLQEVIEICKPDADARKHEVVLSAEGTPAGVSADITRLKQVFWNLLKNSIKFTPDGGRIGIRCHREGVNVVVEVADNGIGIRPDALGKIFGAFEQAGRATNRQFGGLGLGLAITKRLVEMHGGAITAFSSGEGAGAAFRVVLPRCPDAAEARRRGTSEAASPASMQQDGLERKILLVEDHPDSAMMMGELLEAAGYSVKTAASAAQALEITNEEKFELMISDIGLPDGSGYDLMRKIRARSSLKGIALSGFGRDEDIQKGKNAGFVEHLTKPIDLDLLLNAIERTAGRA